MRARSWPIAPPAGGGWRARPTVRAFDAAEPSFENCVWERPTALSRLLHPRLSPPRACGSPFSPPSAPSQPAHTVECNQDCLRAHQNTRQHSRHVNWRNLTPTPLFERRSTIQDFSRGDFGQLYELVQPLARGSSPWGYPTSSTAHGPCTRWATASMTRLRLGSAASAAPHVHWSVRGLCTSPLTVRRCHGSGHAGDTKRRNPAW